jgi:hypothetical protein
MSISTTLLTEPPEYLERAKRAARLQRADHVAA